MLHYLFTLRRKSPQTRIFQCTRNEDRRHTLFTWKEQAQNSQSVTMYLGEDRRHHQKYCNHLERIGATSQSVTMQAMRQLKRQRVNSCHFKDNIILLMNNQMLTSLAIFILMGRKVQLLCSKQKEGETKGIILANKSRKHGNAEPDMLEM